MALTHEPVLLEECLVALAPQDGGLYLDATVGFGGHSRAILEAAQTQIVALDQDPVALAASAQNLAEFAGRVKFVPVNFADFNPEEVLAADFGGFQGVLADLGVSSLQIDSPERGFSWRFEGPLDMRMGRGETTAADLVNTAPEAELARIFHEYGEERYSRRIARALVEQRRKAPFTTTTQLAEAVAQLIGHRQAIHPATRVFQALRIAVNDELGALTRFLERAPDWLATGGVLAVISFHSLEDRLVKWALRRNPELEILTRKPLLPTEAEQRRNPRSRSAKLRYARKPLRNDHDHAS
nr:16S rRNA (cytosine(1402)-N(4))-methyltransferase RsmH [Anthocerotibacter panamensis]